MGVFQFIKNLCQADAEQKTNPDQDRLAGQQSDPFANSRNLTEQDYWPTAFDEQKWLTNAPGPVERAMREKTCKRRAEIRAFAEKELVLRGYLPLLSGKDHYAQSYFLGNHGLGFYCPAACVLVLLESAERNGEDCFRLEVKSLYVDSTEYTADIDNIEIIYNNATINALLEFGDTFPPADPVTREENRRTRAKLAAMRWYYPASYGQTRGEPRPPQD